MKVARSIESVYDPTDKNVVYWVAWSAQDNPDADPWARDTLLHRVFRDDCREQHATPISEPMSRDEAYKLLEQMELLFKGS
jgi:hypothetical protein